MSYVARKIFVFRHFDDPVQILPKRSEGRMKKYTSEFDVRSWATSDREQRRQHILELINRKGECRKLVPFDVVAKIFWDNADDELRRTNRGLRTYEKRTLGYEENFDDDTNEKIARLEETIHEREVQLGIHKQQQEIHDVPLSASDIGDDDTEDDVTWNGIDSDTSKTQYISVNSGYTMACPVCMRYQEEVQSLTRNLAMVQADSDKHKALAIDAIERVHDLEAANIECNELRSQLKDVFDELQHYKENNEIVRVCRATITTSDFSHELEISREQISNLQQEKEMLQVHNNRCIQECRQVIKLKEEDLSNVVAERNNFKDRVKELEEDLVKAIELNKEIGTLQKRSSIFDGVVAERDHLKQELERMRDMERELEELKASQNKVMKGNEIVVLEKDWKKITKLNEAMCGEMAALTSENNALKTVLNEFKGFEEQMDSLRRRSEERDVLMEENSKLRMHLKEFEDLKVDHRREMPHLEFVELEQRILKSKCKLTCHDCRCKEVESELQRVEFDRDSLKKNVQELHCCVTDKNEEIDSLIQQLENLTHVHLNQQKQFKEYCEDVQCKANVKEDNLRTLLSQKQCTIERLHMELLERDKEVKQLRETNKKETRTNNLKAKDDYINRLKKALEAVKHENTKLEMLSMKMKTVSDGSNKFDDISVYKTQIAAQNIRNQTKKSILKTPCRCKHI